MTAAKTMTIDSTEYVRADSVKAPGPTPPVQIVVLQRGWVAVGRWHQDGEDVVLGDARIIRTWGTTKGLGQLAEEGPTKATVLDPAGTLRFHLLTVVARFDTTEALWFA